MCTLSKKLFELIFLLLIKNNTLSTRASFYTLLFGCDTVTPPGYNSTIYNNFVCLQIDSAMQMTPFSDEFLGCRVNSLYTAPSGGQSPVFVNLTLQLEESAETLRPAIKKEIQRHLLGVIHRRSNNIGSSALWVDSPAGSISNLQGSILFYVSALSNTFVLLFYCYNFNNNYIIFNYSIF